MKGKLTEVQKQYVLDHLRLHADWSGELESRIRYNENLSENEASIHFFLSDRALNEKHILTIDGLPVLYPDMNHREAFFELRDGSVIFHHDLLKSAFHLLSGYEEYRSGVLDTYGRFPYSASLQNKLQITGRPLVNEYFEILLDGISRFCTLHKLDFKRKNKLGGPVFMLSHDIDRVDAYHFWEVTYRFKQLLGMAPLNYRYTDTIKAAFKGLFQLLNPCSKTNPFWSFDHLCQSEKALNIKSTYFFLEKQGRHINSRYHFHEHRIKTLIRELSEAGHEIGLHGTIQSACNPEDMVQTLKHLQEVCPETVKGVRQHYLRFKPVRTAQIQLASGLQYDASLGFAEHEGFRNSYCHPFRLYDHEHDCALPLWEIPLNIMEGTLFYYRNLGLEEAMQTIEDIMKQCKRFGGVFSLLWHNHFFDEREFPGIRSFYKQALELTIDQGFRGLTGKEIIRLIKSDDAG
ncbi:MAG: hypothetical protein CSA96_03815 [Bacteroidetes bacterium]|nr:MAG: hypothetical protein CSA96_03815 [Bacteroidota bacterium]